MIQEPKIFKCALCGNIVHLLHEGKGELVCCGEPMNLLIAGEDDTAAKEKHVPVAKVVDGKLRVDVGDVHHPMIPVHYIEFVVLATKTGVFIEFLDPGQEPVAYFALPDSDEYAVYEYCNLHGLWKA